MVRLWYPLAVIPVVYRALEGLVPAVHPRDYDRLLAAEEGTERAARTPHGRTARLGPGARC